MKGATRVSIEILKDGDALALRVADLFALAAQERRRRAAGSPSRSAAARPRAPSTSCWRASSSARRSRGAARISTGATSAACLRTTRASNYGMARDAFIKHVPIAAENVHRMRGEDLPGGGGARVRRRTAPPGRPDAATRGRARLRPRPARPRQRRPHGLALPARRRSDRRGCVLHAGDGARRFAAAHRDGAGDQRRAPRLVPGERRLQGRYGRGGHRGAPRAHGRARPGRRPVHGSLTWFLDEAAAAELSPDARA